MLNEVGKASKGFLWAAAPFSLNVSPWRAIADPFVGNLRPQRIREAPIPMDTMEKGVFKIGRFLNIVQNLSDPARI